MNIKFIEASYSKSGEGMTKVLYTSFRKDIEET